MMMRSRTVQRTWPWWTLATLLLIAAPLSAQPQSNFSISLGWFPTNFSTSAVLSANDGKHSDVDLENDLGLNSNASNVRVEGFWRFAARHRLDYGYTSWRRSAEKTIDTPIDWQDRHYDVGARIKAVNNAQFIKLAYSYAIVRSDVTEFNVSGGFDTIWNRTSLEGEGSITGPNGSLQTGNYKTQENYIAPAPVFGANVSHLVATRTLVRGSAEYFRASVNGTTGKVLDLRGSADYLFTPTFSAGLGYNFVGYKVERAQFDAKYNFSGPLLYVSYRR